MSKMSTTHSRINLGIKNIFVYYTFEKHSNAVKNNDLSSKVSNSQLVLPANCLNEFVFVLWHTPLRLPIFTGYAACSRLEPGMAITFQISHVKFMLRMRITNQ